MENHSSKDLSGKDIEFDPSPIGRGAFGKVYKGKLISTGQIVAIKTVFQDKRYKNRELQVMKELRHPNIVQYLGSYYTKGKTEDEVFLNVVMEYVPVTLSDLLSKYKKANKQFAIQTIKVMAFQMLKSIGYLHSIGICHRDIKPQNIMLNLEDYSLKICDFGCAKRLVKGEPNIAYICSRYYRPPELVLGATEYTTKVDVWSMGCVIVELVTHRPLFPGRSKKDQLTEIIKILGSPSKEQISAMNPDVPKGTKIPFVQRKDWKVYLKDKINDDLFCDLVDKLLTYDPLKRYDPFQAMIHPFFNDLKDKGYLLPHNKPLPKDIFIFSEAEYRCSPGIVAELRQYGQ